MVDYLDWLRYIKLAKEGRKKYWICLRCVQKVEETKEALFKSKWDLCPFCGKETHLEVFYDIIEGDK